MKKVTITKRCHYQPPGGGNKVKVVPGHVVTVSVKDAEKMIKGNVAKEYIEPKPEKPAKKIAPKPKSQSAKK